MASAFEPDFTIGGGAGGSWNSHLGSLAGALFPDPSKMAQGYYYGAEARNKIITGDAATSEQNAAIWLRNMLANPGAQPGTPTYHPSGLANGPPIMNAPPNTPGLPATQTQTQGPGLGQIVAGVSSAADTANGVPPSYDNGQLPPSSSPSPGAPPSPNTTASNGAVPPNDAPAQGNLHPGSFTEAGGGVKMAGPAQANGSPAGVPLNLGTLVGLAAASGYDAQKMGLMAHALITDAMQRGMVSWPVATQLLAGTGNNAPYESDQQTGRTIITDRGQTTREAMSQAGQTQREKMSQTGQTQREEMSQTGQTGRTQMTEAGQTGRTQTTEAGQTERERMSQAGQTERSRLQLDGQTVQVYQNGPDGRPDVNLAPKPMTLGDARKQGMTLTPKSVEDVSAMVRGAAVYGTAGQAAPRLSDVIAGQGQAAQTPATAKETGDELNLTDTFIQHAYPTPDKSIVGTVTQRDPGVLTPQAQAAYQDTKDQLRRTNPRLTGANLEAMTLQRLQNQGYLPTNEQVLAARGKNLGNYWGGNPAVEQQASRGGTQGRFSIPLMKDYQSSTGDVVTANPNQAGAGAGTAAAPAPKQPAAPTTQGPPIARAPAGAQAGQIATLPDGRRGKVGTDGLVYAN